MPARVARPNARYSRDPAIIGIDRSHHASEYNFLSHLLDCNHKAKMTDSDEFYTGMKVDDDLSSVTGIDTLADRDLVPLDLDNISRVRTDGL
jgi:hypothetical protein